MPSNSVVLSDNAITLINVINEEIYRPDVQPTWPDATGNYKTTWCNRAALRILQRMGYNIDPLLNIDPNFGGYSIDYTSADGIYDNAIKNKCKGVTFLTAFYLAQAGIPVLVAAKGIKGNASHVAIVYPSEDIKHAIEHGLMIGQSGGRVGIFNVNEIFLQELVGNVKYFELRKR